MEDDHVRPPVVLLGAEVAVRTLGGERGVDSAAGLLFQRGVVERQREGDEALGVVEPALPIALSALAGAGQPVGVADVVVELLGVAGHAVALLLELAQEPAFGADEAERQDFKGGRRDGTANASKRRPPRWRG